MSDRQPPFISSSNSTSSALLPLWQQLQHHPQQKISTAPGWQEATMQAAINQQEGVVHPYPKRPGEPDCSYYMRTGLCGFGVNCKFNHPPISKLVLNSWVPGQFPERPGQPECQYYLKTGTCKFGFFCKYHHPKEKAGTAGGAQLNILHFPLRPGEKDCAFYLQTGNCKFGATCKFNHPPPLLPVPGGFVLSGALVDVPQFYPTTATYLRSPRPSYLESPRFTGPPNSAPPILTPPNQVSTAPWNSYQVPFLLQEGQHQQGLAGNSVHPALASFQDHFSVGLIPPLMPAGSASFNLTLSAASTPGQLEEGYPQRPGQQECSHYMKTGGCNYGQQCKFHHPRVRNTPSFSSHASSVPLPSRPGAAPCTFFSRFGFCKYGSACKFDHSLMQPAYGHEPSLMAATQITADGMPAAPSAPIISTFTEISSGQPSKSRRDADTLSASIQQLDVQSDLHD